MIKLADSIGPEVREMRTVFAETMTELAEKDERVIYLDCDLMNSVGMMGFARYFPQQTIDCGIQEANMIGVAAGLSATGLIPFAHTFGTFATRRVMDQVYVSVAYADLNVRIIGSDPGISASTNGGTHMPLEDIGMMRCVPNVTILEPVDSVMLADMLRQTKAMYGVFYIRLYRKVVERVFDEGSVFKIGEAIPLRPGRDLTIFASGICVPDAIRAADHLAQIGISAAVSNIHTIKPIDQQAITEAAQTTGAIVTVENHSIVGGLGSAVAEVLAETVNAPLQRVGVADRFGEVGSEDYLKKTLGISVDDIINSCHQVVERKK